MFEGKDFGIDGFIKKSIITILILLILLVVIPIVSYYIGYNQGIKSVKSKINTNETISFHR